MLKKNAFTLAEGATHTNMLQRVGNGFTLAEVLITLAIIGVVAAMTIPTLIAKINSIVTDNQIKVFNAKLIKGMNLTKTAGDLNNTYTSTYDFLTNGLGKNLKMAKVCDSSHIRDCIPYDKIKYDDESNNEYYAEVKDIELKLNLLNTVKGFKDTAAFVLADGTPVIVTYDLDCIDDPDKADTAINACLAGIYDLNGTRKPNKMGQDLITFNGASIKGAVLATLGGVKIMTPAQVPTPVTKAKCEELKANGYPIDWCGYYNNEYWPGAVMMCKDQGYKLPTLQQLISIASELYGTTIKQTGFQNATLDTTKIPKSALSSLGSGIALWSSIEYGGVGAYAWYFLSSGTGMGNNYMPRDSSSLKAICVMD